ncbi:peptidase S16 [Georhizobium profundi]|jgi:uncharacterized protein|uniref:Peptidase S16 n=1 Tax=Georhizobium profundi TaxID=2341112 RepID=A0A3Q8XLJ3_9HYPH|nr:LON peptidase substrate-binding domain-containing protein [Georhizobium profundi]AZN70349.1 peptidase S16 [Georhizobium profundi]GLQ39584.1 ATP-dependent protease [Rhizobium albus]
MQAGNAHYRTEKDLPDSVAMFPLTGALLLPGGQMPLNIFEPRYLAMFDDAMATNRLVGIVQPEFERPGATSDAQSGLCAVGSIGRVVSFSETGDGRYIVSLIGVCRTRLIEEVVSRKPYRTFRIAPFLSDLAPDETADSVDRAALLSSFKSYLDANQLEVDWQSVQRASNTTLVNSMSMMSPYGPPEKQALLEAPDLKTRADTLVAITEIALARASDDYDGVLQ